MDREPLLELDTHVVLWLYAGEKDRLKKVMARLESANLAISPMVFLELEFLHEIGRFRDPPDIIINDLVGRVGLSILTPPFADLARLAMVEKWTRDPFDRLIVATARFFNADLMTADKSILANYPCAKWG